MHFHRKAKDPTKEADLQSSMKELDRLLHTPYTELRGGVVVNNQLSGGDFVKTEGRGYWHEDDTRRVMELRHRYGHGEWQGGQDRCEHTLAESEAKVTLKRSLSAEHLRDLADFVAHAHGDPALADALNHQAMNALVGGDVTEIYGSGITQGYDPVAANAAHKRGYTYFYFEADGSLCGAPPPGVEIELPGASSANNRASSGETA